MQAPPYPGACPYFLCAPQLIFLRPWDSLIYLYSAAICIKIKHAQNNELLASVPGRFFSKDTEGKKIRPGIYCIGDSAHVLTYSLESGESPFSFFDHVSIYVK